MYRFALQIKNLQERLQMDGITQSYNVDDSITMKATKELNLILKERKGTYTLASDEAMGAGGEIKRVEE